MHFMEIFKSRHGIVWINTKDISINLLVFISMFDHLPPGILIQVVLRLLSRNSEMFHEKINAHTMSKFADGSFGICSMNFYLLLLLVFDHDCYLGVS